MKLSSERLGLRFMARGWESKQVEAQIESARETQRGPSDERSAAGQQRQREKQTLLLSRACIQHRIESSGNSRYTESLNKALEEIDRKLAELSRASQSSPSR
jgi:ribosomal protein L20